MTSRAFSTSSVPEPLTGATLLDDGTIAERHGRRVLLMHGDALCTDDVSYQRLRRELLEAERQELRRLRLEGRIDDDVVRRVQRDLDLENERLDI